MPNTYTIKTYSVTVSATPEYMESESIPAEMNYIWLYHIKIENKGKGDVQLISRYWHITDGRGLVQEVRGPGVIGIQPVIEPGDSFEYTSSVSLTTPSGMMHGTYQMKNDGNEIFDVQIPVFSLDSTEQIRRPN